MICAQFIIRFGAAWLFLCASWEPARTVMGSPLHWIGRKLNAFFDARAARKDPTPGEMQYLLRLAELWVEKGDLYKGRRELRRFSSLLFWVDVNHGERVLVDDKIAGWVNAPCRHDGGASCEDYEKFRDYGMSTLCQRLRNNIPENWPTIVRELRGRV